MEVSLDLIQLVCDCTKSNNLNRAAVASLFPDLGSILSSLSNCELSAHKLAWLDLLLELYLSQLEASFALRSI